MLLLTGRVLIFILAEIVVVVERYIVVYCSSSGERFFFLRIWKKCNDDGRKVGGRNTRFV